MFINLAKKIIRTGSFICVCLMLACSLCTAKNSGIFSRKCFSLPVGKDILLSPFSRANNDFEWFVSDKSVATIDSCGMMHAKSVGKVTVNAVNKKSGEKSTCLVEITGEEPIKFVYTSLSIASTNQKFNLEAITPKSASKVKFEVSSSDYDHTVYCSDEHEENGCYVWSKEISVPSEGTFDIKAYAKINGIWQTCSDGHTQMYIKNGYSKSKAMICERRVSPECVRFIGSCEGFASKAYRDSSGFFTIGYGKRIFPFEVFYNNLSKREGMYAFSKILNQGLWTKNLNRFLIKNNIKSTQHQFDALVSFSYNIGYAWISHNSALGKILLSSGGQGEKWYATVNSSNGLYIRREPSATSKKLGILKDKAVVEVLNHKKNQDWCQIKSDDGTIGYCFAEYMKIYSINGGEKNLLNINSERFIEELAMYHHIGKTCHKGILRRRFYELDMFFYGKYNNIGSVGMGIGKYPIPMCAKKLFR